MQRIAEFIERQRLDVELQIGPVIGGRGGGKRPQLRGCHGQRAGALEQIFQPHHGAVEQRLIFAVHGFDAGNLINRPDLQMILQIRTDTGLVDHDIHAVVAQHLGRTDARQVQQMRRADGSRRNNHLGSGFGSKHLTRGVAIAHAGGAALFDGDFFHQNPRLHDKVGAVQHGLQKAARRAVAAAVFLVDVEIGAAVVVAGVEILDAGNTGLFGGIDEAVEQIPLYARRFDAPFAAGLMEAAIGFEMVFLLLVKGQKVIPAPAFEAEIAPAVIILRLSAHIDHGIDGRTAAEHFTTRIGDGASAQTRFGLGFEHPVGARIADGKQIADRNMEPDPVVVAARFEQQHTVARIGRQAIGKDASGRARAHDDIIKLIAVE